MKYENQEALDEIVAWIRAELAAAPSSPDMLPLPCPANMPPPPPREIVTAKEYPAALKRWARNRWRYCNTPAPIVLKED